MYKRCKTEQSVNRQREIEKGFLEMLKEKKYEDITVSEICLRMNMPRKAFYRYFDAKDDVLSAMLDHTMSEYSGFSVDRSGESKRSLELELEEYFKYWYEKRHMLTALDNSGMIGALIERTINYPVGDRIVTNKFLPDDTDVVRERVFKFAFAGLVYTMIEWYRNGFDFTTKEMAKIACRLLQYPLFPSLKNLGIE